MKKTCKVRHLRLNMQRDEAILTGLVLLTKMAQAPLMPDVNPTCQVCYTSWPGELKRQTLQV